MLPECSKRWNHSLDPNLDHSAWTHEEVHETLSYPANLTSPIDSAKLIVTEHYALSRSENARKPLEGYTGHPLLRKIVQQHKEPVSQVLTRLPQV